LKLTEKEEKIARLAFDKAAQLGERQAAAAKLMKSLYVRGVSVEDIERQSVRIEYRERARTRMIYRDRPVVSSHVWTWILGVAAAFIILLILLTFARSNSAPSPVTKATSAPAPTTMTAEKREQQEALWEQVKEADRKERQLLQKQEAERRARYEAEPEQDSVIGATPAPQ
jgi:hypothetical protein